MFLSESKDFKYKKWEKKKEKQSFFYTRTCLSQKNKMFSAFIYPSNDINNKKYRCQVPTPFNINRLNTFKTSSKSEDVYVKEIKDTSSLEEAVLWVELFIFKQLKSTCVENPFLFLWYDE